MTWRERAERLHARLAPWPAGSMEQRRYLIAALAGEAGELVNLMCRGWRGEPVDPNAVAAELADVAIYTHLAARALGIDLNAACERKTRANDVRFAMRGPRAWDVVRRMTSIRGRPVGKHRGPKRDPVVESAHVMAWHRTHVAGPARRKRR